MPITRILRTYSCDGLHIRLFSDGKRTINGLPCGLSSLSDIELAAANGLRPMPPLDEPSLPELQP